MSRRRVDDAQGVGAARGEAVGRRRRAVLGREHVKEAAVGRELRLPRYALGQALGRRRLAPEQVQQPVQGTVGSRQRDRALDGHAARVDDGH
ncbi:MAG TPA: hypothetical protein VG370_23800, partial [Chloroflexota bacterium]|nr:hypothetical protein [Chloroflexota bacterium]